MCLHARLQFNVKFTDIYSMMDVRPKKYLGQHFLRDKNIAKKIVESLIGHGHYQQLIEIGPGTGILTNFLLAKPHQEILLVEIDRESVRYLQENYQQNQFSIIEKDFLKIDLTAIVPEKAGIIGNFPYNISSQIFFKILENKNLIPEVVCMIQKEVAERICAPHGNKTYGILSVLIQAFYDVKILFKVPAHVFFPPPKVESAVIRLTRNRRNGLPCDESFFFKVVKQAFQNRRKTLRNALKAINLPIDERANPIWSNRAEQLAIEDFIALAVKLEKYWS